jgi:hypothetical protein
MGGRPLCLIASWIGAGYVPDTDERREAPDRFLVGH